MGRGPSSMCHLCSDAAVEAGEGYVDGVVQFPGASVVLSTCAWVRASRGKFC
jgi:hypothetical protein